MEFDNNKALYSVMRIELIATILFAGSFSVSFLDIYKTDFLPLKGYQFALIIVLFFVSLSYVWYGLKHTYFSINTNGENILIKYFRITPKFIKPKPKMVQIPKRAFVKYKIENSFMGKRKALYLFQRTNKGVVKYPPIYITSLNANELEKLKLALQV